MCFQLPSDAGLLVCAEAAKHNLSLLPTHSALRTIRARACSSATSDRRHCSWVVIHAGRGTVLRYVFHLPSECKMSITGNISTPADAAFEMLLSQVLVLIFPYHSCREVCASATRALEGPILQYSCTRKYIHLQTSALKLYPSPHVFSPIRHRHQALKIRFPDSRIYVYGSDKDCVESYDWGPEGRFPTAHFWDPEARNGIHIEA